MTRKQPHLLYFLFLALLLSTTLAAANYSYRIFETYSRAEHLQKQLKPLFSQAAFSADGHRLIVKAPAAMMREIEAVVAKINQPPKNLIIEVASQKQLDAHLQNTTIKNNSTARTTTREYDYPGARIAYYRQSDGKKGKIIATYKQSQRREDRIYKTRTLENTWVSLYSGKEIPHLSRTFINGHVIPAHQSDYKSIKSGFQARVNLLADKQVHIEIRSQYQNTDRLRQQHIQQHQYQTTVSGKLNEWIAIGNISAQLHNSRFRPTMASADSGGVSVNYHNRGQQQNMQFYIRVSLEP